MKVSQRVFLSCAAALLLIPAAVPAQGNDLPPAQQLVDRYVKAIGGAEAYQKHNSMRANLTIDMPAAGMRAEAEIKQLKPDRMVMTTTIPGMGEMRTGYDGNVAWAIDAMQGPRLLTGPELASTKDQARWETTLRTPEVVSEMQTVERTEMGGQQCYKVHVKWRSGRESQDCYAVDTGLLVGTVAEQESQMGKVRVETLMQDYKEFDGIHMPTRMTQSMMGMQATITLTDVEFGTVTEADVAPPEQIRALAAGDGAN